MSFINVIIVGLGGFIGTVLRYLIGSIPVRECFGFPVKTFAINVIGAFVIGLVAAMAAHRDLDPRLVLFLKVGICGGFTTFSSFTLETSSLLKGGNTVTAACYLILSIVAGVAAVFCAEAIMR
ncbi:MAG: fluoride efflux transporter CrcB [Oribacterium sp.]|nr:fluoride efflux transporter CrcB [Oribacterium sp.]